jgi:hypothetical protein
VVTRSEGEEGRSGPSESAQPESSALPRPRTDGAQEDVHQVDARQEDARPEVLRQEVLRQQEELAALHAQLDTRGRSQRRVTTLRRTVAALLVVVAALGLTASVVGVWAGRTTLNTDRWVATVTPLAEDPAVQAAVSTYMTAQIFDTLDVQQRVEEALPPRAAFLATPLTSRMRSYVHDSVDKVLASEQFARLWPEMNRRAHRQVMAVINSESNVVRERGDRVTLNLLPVVNEVLRLLEQQVPTLFGRTLNLPSISNGQIPAGLEARIESALGVKLPSNFGEVTIYRGDELAAAQDAVVNVKKFLLLLVLGSFLALALALWISPWRRRTTLQLGIWLVISVVAMTSLLRAIRAQLVEEVPAGVLRDGADAAAHVVFTTLRERGTQLLWLGIVIALVAYLVGPARVPVALRRWSVDGARVLNRGARRYSAVAIADGPGLVRTHLDALRIGGLVVAGALLLFFSSWTGLFVIASVLGLYELLVTGVAAAAHEPAADPVRSPAPAAQSSRSTVSTP